MIFRSSPQQPSSVARANSRRGAVAWAQGIIRDRNSVYLDTETTGLDGSAEIIEISILDTAGRVLLDTLVRPQGRIPRDAQAIHGISDSMVASSPEWIEIYPEVAAIVVGKTVVVYNAEFDLRMVAQMNWRYGIRPTPQNWQCAMKQYSSFAGVWHERYGNYRWHQLGRAAASFGHPEGGHRALADANACRLVVDGMAAG